MQRQKETEFVIIELDKTKQETEQEEIDRLLGNGIGLLEQITDIVRKDAKNINEYYRKNGNSVPYCRRKD